MDLESRELRYRSSARMGQWDWDVENLRYNQFVKMLKKNVCHEPFSERTLPYLDPYLHPTLPYSNSIIPSV